MTYHTFQIGSWHCEFTAGIRFLLGISLDHKADSHTCWTFHCGPIALLCWQFYKPF